MSQTTFKQFPSLLLNGPCGSGLWPTRRGVWFPGPRTSTQPERGGRVGGQTDKAAGSRVASSRRYVLPAVCPSPSLSAPVGSSGLAIRSPLWKAPQPPGSGFHTKMSPSGQRQWMRGDLGNQPPCALQGRDCWLTASCGP